MAKITIDKSCCKGCYICVNICPKKVFTSSKQRSNYGTNMPEAKNADVCIHCRMCERQCPDGAIDVEKELKPISKNTEVGSSTKEDV